MNLSIGFSKFCFLTISALSLIAGIAVTSATKVQAAAAAVIADTPCDPLYYESLSARAWLEAEREITQNQNIILKPDSVFEYTCFDGLLRELAIHASDMLTETTDYDKPLDSDSMDKALQALIGESLIKYIDLNFGSKSSGTAYNLLGGHPAATGINHTPQAITSSPSYSCDIMKRVWQAAKCINFITDNTYDGFYTFEEYANASKDKRYLPKECKSIASNWKTNLTTALTSGPWTNDPVQTYFTLTDAEKCTGTNCKCSGSPIPTGVQVYRSGYDKNDYPEKVCLQAGCRYHPGGELTKSGGSAAEGCYGR